MIKQVLGLVDYSACAEIALCLFVTVFIAVGLRTLFWSNKDWVNNSAALPLDDGEVEQQ